MPRTAKAKAKSDTKARPFYASQPWQCRHQADRSELLAYVEANGAWEVVAVIPRTSGASAEKLATYILNVINDNQQSQNLLQAAIHALELVVEDNGLTFSSEQEVDSVIARLKKSRS